jgi:hypothetical protein
MKSLFVDTKFLKLNPLQNKYEQILDEYKKFESELEFKDFTNEQNSYIEKCKKGYPITQSSYFSARNRKINENGWHVAAISVNNINYSRNSDLLPILSDTIGKIGNICVCGINILDPKTKLEWHTDMEYSNSNNSLRCLWVLDSPEKDCIIQLKDEKTGEIETKNFEKNEIYSFFHYTTHRVENSSNKSRVAIAFDISTSPSFSYDW